MLDVFKKVENKEDLTLEELDYIKEHIKLKTRRGHPLAVKFALDIAVNYDFITGKYIGNDIRIKTTA